MVSMMNESILFPEDAGFEKCGTVFVSTRHNICTITCTYCHDVFSELQEFKRHLQQEHNDELQFGHKVKDVGVYSIEELMQAEGKQSEYKNADKKQTAEQEEESEESGLAEEDDDQWSSTHSDSGENMELEKKAKNNNNMSILRALKDMDVSMCLEDMMDNSLMENEQNDAADKEEDNTLREEEEESLEKQQQKQSEPKDNANMSESILKTIAEEIENDWSETSDLCDRSENKENNNNLNETSENKENENNLNETLNETIVISLETLSQSCTIPLNQTNNENVPKNNENLDKTIIVPLDSLSQSCIESLNIGSTLSGQAGMVGEDVSKEKADKTVDSLSQSCEANLAEKETLDKDGKERDSAEDIQSKSNANEDCNAAKEVTNAIAEKHINSAPKPRKSAGLLNLLKNFDDLDGLDDFDDFLDDLEDSLEENVESMDKTEVNKETATENQEVSVDNQQTSQINILENTTTPKTSKVKECADNTMEALQLSAIASSTFIEEKTLESAKTEEEVVADDDNDDNDNNDNDDENAKLNYEVSKALMEAFAADDDENELNFKNDRCLSPQVKRLMAKAIQEDEDNEDGEEMNENKTLKLIKDETAEKKQPNDAPTLQYEEKELEQQLQREEENQPQQSEQQESHTLSPHLQKLMDQEMMEEDEKEENEAEKEEDEAEKEEAEKEEAEEDAAEKEDAEKDEEEQHESDALSPFWQKLIEQEMQEENEDEQQQQISIENTLDHPKEEEKRKVQSLQEKPENKKPQLETISAKNSLSPHIKKLMEKELEDDDCDGIEDDASPAIAEEQDLDDDDDDDDEGVESLSDSIKQLLMQQDLQDEFEIENMLLEDEMEEEEEISARTEVKSTAISSKSPSPSVKTSSPSSKTISPTSKNLSPNAKTPSPSVKSKYRNTNLKAKNLLKKSGQTKEQHEIQTTSAAAALNPKTPNKRSKEANGSKTPSSSILKKTAEENLSPKSKKACGNMTTPEKQQENYLASSKTPMQRRPKKIDENPSPISQKHSESTRTPEKEQVNSKGNRSKTPSLKKAAKESLSPESCSSITTPQKEQENITAHITKTPKSKNVNRSVNTPEKEQENISAHITKTPKSQSLKKTTEENQSPNSKKSGDSSTKTPEKEQENISADSSKTPRRRNLNKPPKHNMSPKSTETVAKSPTNDSHRQKETNSPSKQENSPPKTKTPNKDADQLETPALRAKTPRRAKLEQKTYSNTNKTPRTIKSEAENIFNNPKTQGAQTSRLMDIKLEKHTPASLQFVNCKRGDMTPIKTSDLFFKLETSDEVLQTTQTAKDKKISPSNKIIKTPPNKPKVNNFMQSILKTPGSAVKNCSIKLQRLTSTTAPSEYIKKENSNNKTAEKLTQLFKLPQGITITKLSTPLNNQADSLDETPIRSNYCKQNFSEQCIQQLSTSSEDADQQQQQQATKQNNVNTTCRRSRKASIDMLPANNAQRSLQKAGVVGKFPLSTNKTPRLSGVDYKSHVVMRTARKREVLKRMSNIRKNIFKPTENIENQCYNNILTNKTLQDITTVKKQQIFGQQKQQLMPLKQKQSPNHIEIRNIDILPSMNTQLLTPLVHNGGNKSLIKDAAKLTTPSALEEKQQLRNTLKRPATSPLDEMKQHQIKKQTIVTTPDKNSSDTTRSNDLNLSEGMVQFLQNDAESNGLNVDNILNEELANMDDDNKTEQSSSKQNNLANIKKETKQYIETPTKSENNLVDDLLEQMEDEIQTVQEKQLPSTASENPNEDTESLAIVEDYTDEKDLELLRPLGLEIIINPDGDIEKSIEEVEEMQQKAKEFSLLLKNKNHIWSAAKLANKPFTPEITISFNDLMREVLLKFDVDYKLNDMKRIVNLIILWFLNNQSRKLLEKKKILPEPVQACLKLFTYLPKTVSRQLFYCEFCDHLETKDHSYFVHRMKHIGAKFPYECKICRLGFGQKFRYKNHVKQCPPSSVSNDNGIVADNTIALKPALQQSPSKKGKRELYEDSFQCHVCEYECNSAELIYEHSKRHRKSIYTCAKCNVAFDTVQSVNVHMKECNKRIQIKQQVTTPRPVLRK